MVAFTSPMVGVVGNVMDCKAFGYEHVHASCSDIGKAIEFCVRIERNDGIL
jgi:hypothetical protein